MNVGAVFGGMVDFDVRAREWSLLPDIWCKNVEFATFRIYNIADYTLVPPIQNDDTTNVGQS